MRWIATNVHWICALCYCKQNRRNASDVFFSNVKNYYLASRPRNISHKHCKSIFVVAYVSNYILILAKPNIRLQLIKSISLESVLAKKYRFYVNRRNGCTLADIQVFLRWDKISSLKLLVKYFFFNPRSYEKKSASTEFYFLIFFLRRSTRERKKKGKEIAQHIE